MHYCTFGPSVHSFLYCSRIYKVSMLEMYCVYNVYIYNIGLESPGRHKPFLNLSLASNLPFSLVKG
jgi:hypothetical protein